LRAIAVIPARYASTRFPGKPVYPLLGRPMIEWVVEAARKSPAIAEVCVATDDERIADVARSCGALVAMTSPDCASGTDRVAEAARAVPELSSADVFVNVQGDEPALDPRDLDLLVGAFDCAEPPQMATLARPIDDAEELWSPDVVKVVRAFGGDALYFSRSPLPHYRDAWSGDVLGSVDAPKSAPAGAVAPLAHIGVYAFTAEALQAFPRLPKGRLESAESLEQLRALEAGWKIRVLDCVGRPGVGVDRPEDVPAAEALLSEIVK
jgi:3-deoxy-manno-octulosonate cytidylyltransferase (CMP-KDO synthetase)